MNKHNHIKDKKLSSKTDFTISVAVTYISLLALMLLLTGRVATAGMSDSFKEHSSNEVLNSLTVVGKGELSWLGFSIYHASLLTPDGKFQNLNQTSPIALAITYQRDIDASDLAEKTVEEWERLGIFKGDERLLWGKRLANIWPDVKPQDNITTLVTPDNKTRFYHNDRLLVVLDEPGFGKALLSIWLDPETSEPELREQLIGKGEKN